MTIEQTYIKLRVCVKFYASYGPYHWEDHGGKKKVNDSACGRSIREHFIEMDSKPIKVAIKS